MADLWISSPPDSPASPHPWRVSAEAQLMIAGSGPKSAGLSGSTGLPGVFWRTFLASSAWASMTYSATWTLRATRRGRLFIRLRLSARPTSASASSLWPTVTSTAGDGRSEQTVATWQARRQRTLATKRIHNGLPLNVAVKMANGWPTPRHEGFDAGGHHGKADSLHAAVKQWPPVTAHGNTNRRGASAKSGDGLRTAVMSYPTPNASPWRSGVSGPHGQHSPNLPEFLGGKLNPAWVEQLQGFPAGWTEIDGPLAQVKHSTSGKRRGSRANAFPTAPRD